MFFSSKFRTFSARILSQKRFLCQNLTVPNESSVIQEPKKVHHMHLELTRKRLKGLREVMSELDKKALETHSYRLKEDLIQTVELEQVKDLIRNNFRIMEHEHLSMCFISIKNIIAYNDPTEEMKIDFLSSKEVGKLLNFT